MTVSTAVEAEASSVPTEGLALSMSTMDPGDRVTPVSSSECILFISFKGVVGISGGSSHGPSSSICKTQSDTLMGTNPSRHSFGGRGVW